MLRRALRLALFFAGACWLLAAASTLADWDDYRERGLDWLLAARLLALGGGAVAGVSALRHLRAGRAQTAFLAEVRTARPIHRFVLCFAAALVATTLAQAAGWLGESVFAASRCFSTTLVAGLAVWTTWLVARPDAVSRPSHHDAAARDAILTAGLVVLVAVEAGLAAWASTGLAGRLFDTGDAAERIASWRLAPGQSWLGARANAAGYLDDEFFAAGERDLVVALVADSFGVGVVARSQHFATRIEERLRAAHVGGYERIAVHNFSVPRIGIAEYRWLIDEVVLASNPSRVVVCVFVGNDVLDARGRHTRFALQGWWLWKIPQRAWLASRARKGRAPAPSGASAPEQADRTDFDTDFDDDTFLGIELARLTVVDGQDAGLTAGWGRLEAGLAAIHARLGERLLVVVIPDEFQVSDALWSRLLARVPDPERFDRDLPQRRIAAFCAAGGIECLDLLGALRDAEREDATYRPRDTHWNERGNRVAGDAIADRLLRGP